MILAKDETDCCFFESKPNDCRMNYEKFRLESFRCWPIPWISTRELAANGFFFKNMDTDVVECNFCKVKLYHWEAEDTPSDQHKKWAPYCPFINGEETKNVPLVNKKQCDNIDEYNGSGSQTSTV